ncbi:MAG: hypothetical protein Q8K18_08350 [Burkholderiales bacterium]|nr:hypothetical protein [Burkholderiales bacterium]
MVRAANSAIHSISRQSSRRRPGLTVRLALRLKRAQHLHHDGNIARSAAANLIECFGEQAGKGLADGDDPQFPILMAMR